MLELNRFRYFTGFKALYANPDSFGGAVYESPNGLQIRHESPAGDAGYLLSDAAFFLGQASASNLSASDRFFTAYCAYFRHFVHSILVGVILT